MIRLDEFGAFLYFDTKLAADDADDSSAQDRLVRQSVLGQCQIFDHPGVKYTPGGRFENQHTAVFDAIITLRNAIAIALDTKWGVRDYPDLDMTGIRDGNDPNAIRRALLDKPLHGIYSNMVLVAFDAEFLNYNSLQRLPKL